jgi:hypothetical protein
MAFPIIAAVGRLAIGGASRGAITTAATGKIAKTLSGANINVQTNLKAVEKAIDAFGKNQIPFAMANTLNDAAFQIRKNTIENVWTKDVKVKNPAFMRAVMMPIKGDNRATKRKLRAIVQNYPSGNRHKDFLQRLAVGGIKSPRGRSIAIPASDMPLRARGGVTARNRPRPLLDRPKVFRQRVGGQDMILQRATKKPYPLKRLYILEQGSVKIDNQFSFYEDADRLSQRVMRENFRKNFARAKASARRFK